MQGPQYLPLLSPRLLAALLALLVRTVLCGALVEELRVGLHQQLQDVEGKTVYSTVPMMLRVLVQRPDDDREELRAVLIDQLHYVVVVPEEERALGYLEVGAGDAERQAPEELLLHAVKLRRLRELERFLEHVEEEHLLGRDRQRPVAQHRRDYVVGQARVLLDVLCHAVGELLVEGRERLDLVQRNQRLDQEVLVLGLQGQSEAIDDASKDLEQLANTAVGLTLVDHLEEYVLDGAPDERPQRHELAVDAVQDGLQVVALAWVFGVKQL
mmetsp:Transcript_21723/g.59364  ORF Transcript_21723/g.59364 Transcript_21723/m.59364 type:complete len:270 (+) Transcript_21723:203-1012(+)